MKQKVIKEIRNYLSNNEELMNYLSKVFPTNDDINIFIDKMSKNILNKLFKMDLEQKFKNILLYIYPQCTKEDIENRPFNKEMAIDILIYSQVKIILDRIYDNMVDLQKKVLKDIY